MKTPQVLIAIAFGFLLLPAALFTGCKTTPPPVDWNARVGNYTYDQAVLELGPPNKTAKLSDGQTTVAEWVMGQRQHSSVSVGTSVFGGGYNHTGYGVGVGQTVGGGYSDRVLRLTFDAANRLVGWTKNY